MFSSGGVGGLGSGSVSGCLGASAGSDGSVWMGIGLIAGASEND